MANQVQGKVFHDPVHGQIELHPLLVKIIDTPQFQRLRNIKQLSGVHFVYPGATHARFEHSIGVAYLAGELVKALQSRQPELNITDIDVLCVQIAGLCHDLGHGPFSHLFDEIVKATDGTNWKHEDASLKMFDYMVRENELADEMKKYKLDDVDHTLIKKMIEFSYEADPAQKEEFEKRIKDKFFLFEIVANKENGIDVDKFDYLARDCYHMGLPSTFDYRRFFLNARVCEVDKEEPMHICSRDKDVDNLYEMFHSRYSIHRRACQHRVTQSVHHMITDAFMEANEHIRVTGSDGKEFTLSKAINDMEAFTKLTDQVFEQILHSVSKELEHARGILENIFKRKLYMFVGETKNTDNPEKKIDSEKIQKLEAALGKDKITVHEFKFDYGMIEKDPIVQSTYFYRKQDPNHGFKLKKDQVSTFIPQYFCEQITRVFLKNMENDGKELQKAKDVFSAWCKDNGLLVNEEQSEEMEKAGQVPEPAEDQN